MVNFKKQYHKLYKYYDKELKKCHKYGFKYISLDYFNTYLRYMRDYYLLTNVDKVDITDDICIMSLCEAVAEYETYATCITKYYKANDRGVILALDQTKSKEEIAAEYQKEKSAHWQRFWELAQQYMESWTGLDDFTI